MCCLSDFWGFSWSSGATEEKACLFAVSPREHSELDEETAAAADTKEHPNIQVQQMYPWRSLLIVSVAVLWRKPNVIYYWQTDVWVPLKLNSNMCVFLSAWQRQKLRSSCRQKCINLASLHVLLDWSGKIGRTYMNVLTEFCCESHYL